MGSFKMNLSNIFNEMRTEDVKKSAGVICEECNQEAYYFNTKNEDFFSEQNCLICRKEKFKGILLEDFQSVLISHIGKHYELIQNDTSETISLKKVLERFTYDEDQFLEKLANLLCVKGDRFFQLEGVYKSTVDKVLIEKYKDQAIEKWARFSKELKHYRRFTNTAASSFF